MGNHADCAVGAARADIVIVSVFVGLGNRDVGRSGLDGSEGDSDNPCACCEPRGSFFGRLYGRYGSL